MGKKKIKLTWRVDPSHAWLEVPEKVCTELGVILSGYSYVSADGRTYYAEEDCDAPLVIEALKSAGFGIAYSEVLYEGRFPERFRLHYMPSNSLPRIIDAAIDEVNESI